MLEDHMILAGTNHIVRATVLALVEAFTTDVTRQEPVIVFDFRMLALLFVRMPIALMLQASLYRRFRAAVLAYVVAFITVVARAKPIVIVASVVVFILSIRSRVSFSSLVHT
jgi:hypothetical protein